MAISLTIRGIEPVTTSELYLPPSVEDLMGSSTSRQIIPVIYTEYHFDDLKFTLLHYTKDIIEKHDGLGIALDRHDIALCWEIQVRRYFPDRHPMRRLLLKQVDFREILCDPDSRLMIFL